MIEYQKVMEAMIELDDESLIPIAKEVMEAGGEDAQTIMRACQEGMNEVGLRFEQGEYFIGDLVFAGELMGRIMDIVRPALAAGSESKLGKMILCTVKDDLHDIGKNIVKAMFEAGGFEVIDLGIDVPPERIVEEAKANGVSIVGLSGVLTLAIDSMKATVDAFTAAGIRDNIRIIVGGNPVTEEGCKFIGADAWAINPQDSVKICRDWISGA